MLITTRPFERIASFGAALLTTVLVGCVAEMPSPPGTDRFLVEPVRFTHQVTPDGGTGELGIAEQAELAAFLQDADPDNRADIYLDAHGPGRNSQIDAVAAALRTLGRKSAGAVGGEAVGQGVTVTLLQDVILPEACLSADDWPHPDLPPASCAHALTLVRMVENQDDLLYGRTMGPAMSAGAANAASRHYERIAPARDGAAGSGDEATPELPPSPLTRDASY
ncbi:MAG: hypothetical protein ACR2QJ_09165 [Geminicoccaceae bacterium]